jgi:hypothetical protein
MSGYTITDTNTTIKDTPDAITAAVDGVRPAAGVSVDLVVASKNVPIRVVVLRVAGSDAGTGDTYSVHRLVTAGAPSTTNAIAMNQPIDAGESHSFDNLVVNPGYKIVVVSANGRVTFSADIGEEP